MGFWEASMVEENEGNGTRRERGRVGDNEGNGRTRVWTSMAVQ